MKKVLAKNIANMKEISAKISTLVSQMEHTPEHLLKYKFNQQTDALHTLIVKLYSYLNVYHRQVSGVCDMPKKFPAKGSGLCKIKEMRSDYLKIKMPLLYRKKREDNILIDDLYAMFFDMAKTNISFPKMPKKEIVFTFIYNASTPPSFIRDNDNYAIRGVINTIISFLGDSDSGDTTWLSIRTLLKENTENHTIVEVIKKD